MKFAENLILQFSHGNDFLANSLKLANYMIDINVYILEFELHVNTILMLRIYARIKANINEIHMEKYFT